jgi:hypothetical protein
LYVRGLPEGSVVVKETEVAPPAKDEEEDTDAKLTS